MDGSTAERVLLFTYFFFTPFVSNLAAEKWNVDVSFLYNIFLSKLIFIHTLTFPPHYLTNTGAGAMSGNVKNGGADRREKVQKRFFNTV